AFDDPEAVFALHDCPITDDRVLGAWQEILAAAAHLPDEDRLRGTVRWIGERPAFVLEGGTEWPALQRFLDAAPTIAAVWWQGTGKRRRLVADRRSSATPGASFLQVNEALAARMHRDVLGRVLAHAP